MSRHPVRAALALSALLASIISAISPTPARAAPPPPQFRAGAAAVDVTPVKWPVIVNGNFLSAQADQALDPLHARCLVLDDGTTAIALCVVDTCVLPHELVDEARGKITAATGIPGDRVMISATHTHTAPSLMAVLGTEADPHYPPFLIEKLVETVSKAKANLTPARAGWAVVKDFEHTHCRQWIYRPDRMLTDPFGGVTVRCNMHPGYRNASTIGPSGPVDPDLSVLAVQTADGRPLAVMANYSMHYFGSGAVSADYFGRFCAQLQKAIAPEAEGDKPFVAIMSQGTSGDLHWMDYAEPQRNVTIDGYAAELAKLAHDAYKTIEYRTDVPLAMAERKLRLNVRAPDAERLAWAKGVLDKLGGRLPQSLPEVYAKEAFALHEHPTRDVKVAAVRIGDLGIATISCEVFGLTGLKIKAQSPLKHTFNVELANGEDGYIPPRELHPLGGYTTWPARSACLEPGAEAKIVEAVVVLLEQVSGQARKAVVDTHGAYAKQTLAAKPLAYWRLNEMAGPTVADAGGNNRPLQVEDGVVFHLEGPEEDVFSGTGVINRAPHFAGGRMTADLAELGPAYSVELWFWNGLPGEARPVAGYLFSRGPDRDPASAGDHLGIGGTHTAQDRLLFFNGNAVNQVLQGTSPIAPRTWNHVVLVRDGRKVAVFLNGNPQPEIAGEADVTVPAGVGQIFLGGRNDNMFNLEGKLDEVAVFNRALTPEEATARYKTTGRPVTRAPEAPVLPRSPEETLKSLKVRDGFEVQLVAAEPLVLDPVAIAWGPDGKLWVAEMSDYPTGIDGNGKAGGRIRFLEDTNADGSYDKSTLLLDGVNFPNSVMPWRDGVLVTAAPEIFYAADTDGDGKADVRQSLYVGFTEGNTQLRVNGLKWGLDNWVYLANGWSSRDPVRSVKTLEQVETSGRDLRIKPDEGLLDPETGMTEYGRDRDDFGNWFGCNNSYPMWHFVLADRYTRRNPHVAPPEPIVQLTGANPKVFPLSRGQKRYHSFEQAGHFTSACSTMVYRDDLLFARGSETHHFVCEPVHNVVQHRVSRQDGVTFGAAERAPGEEKIDFLASDDEWFRPVNLATGPDGALYVADMYRYMVEHPEWLPPVGQNELKPFLRTGHDRGRIWRIVKKGQPLRPVARLDKLSGPELAAALDSANGWQRDMAHQLILWRKGAAAAPKLEELVTRSENPLARLHALCALDGLGALRPELLAKAMADAHPAVRQNAVRIAEPMAKGTPGLIEAAARLADDPDPKVRLQLACSLGEWADLQAGAALGRLALKNADDVYISAAVMSSAVPHYATIVDTLLASGAPTRGPLYRNLLNMALALNNREVMARLLEPVVTPKDGTYAGEQLVGWAAWLDLLASRGISPQQVTDAAKDSLAERMNQGVGLLDAAREAAIDDARPAEERAAAASLLGRDPAELELDRSILIELMKAQVPPEAQRAAVRSIARAANDATVPDVLTSNWAGLSPEIRLSAVDLLLGQEPWAFELLKRIETGKATAGDIDVSRRQRLGGLNSQRVNELAGKVLGDASNEARAKVVEKYQPALKLTGDVKRGLKAYVQNCAVCHKYGEHGNEIGPDLRSVRDWPAENILTNIIDPNAKVEPRYLSYTATLNNGDVVFGVITAETGNSLTMVGLDGKVTTILRGDLKSLEGSNKSLMPDGLESALSKQAVADVIRFLKEPPAPAP
jgi:putative membrane-bound dehydrogenase-like protein